jgi:pyruvate kinase
MPRSTKIVATLGPASSDPDMLDRLIGAGVDVVRLNFSHGRAHDHIERARMVREIAARHKRGIAILADLQGPKIRVGKFKEGKVTLENGAAFVLDADAEIGDEQSVGTDYKELPQDVKTGDILLLDDGKIVLTVGKVVGNRVNTIVKVGGVLSNNKGINKQGGGLTAPPLTSKDIEDIHTAVALRADYLAISFPKSGADMYMARELMRASGGKSLLIAKIERAEAIPALEEILKASDGIMVARGDLAIEVGDAAVPALQKRMIRMAREMNKLTITATQMMESMISSPVPTRAEVSDCANAVLDGTDAVMLSAESASGKFPVEAVEAMARICSVTDKSMDAEVKLDQDFLNRVFTRIDQSIAMATLFTAHHLKIKAIVALTQSGSTALWMSRLNSGVPIYALTPDPDTYTKLALFRDTRTFLMTDQSSDRDQLLQESEDFLVQQGVLEKGDLIVITIGEPIGKTGGTNTMKIVRVGEQ